MGFVPVSGDDLSLGLRVLRRGGVLLGPTRTNYNLMCDARNGDAVQRIFSIKKRRKLGPLPVNVPNFDSVETRIDPMLRGRLSAACHRLWPGEISFILPVADTAFPAQLTLGVGTIAFSNSSHPFLKKLTEDFGGPLACSSANISGRDVSRVSIDVALGDVGQSVDFISVGSPDDLGDSLNGIASGNTIIDLSFESPILLRNGSVSQVEVEKFFPNLEEKPVWYERRLAERARKGSAVRPVG